MFRFVPTRKSFVISGLLLRQPECAQSRDSSVIAEDSKSSLFWDPTEVNPACLSESTIGGRVRRRDQAGFI